MVQIVSNCEFYCIYPNKWFHWHFFSSAEMAKYVKVVSLCCVLFSTGQVLTRAPNIVVLLHEVGLYVRARSSSVMQLTCLLWDGKPIYSFMTIQTVPYAHQCFLGACQQLVTFDMPCVSAQFHTYHQWQQNIPIISFITIILWKYS